MGQVFHVRKFYQFWKYEKVIKYEKTIDLTKICGHLRFAEMEYFINLVKCRSSIDNLSRF